MSGDNVILNLTCSNDSKGGRADKLPERLPDGSKIRNNQRLTKRLFKSHEPATKSGNVFIPKHKLPVLDEFGLIRPKDVIDTPKANKSSLAPNQNSPVLNEFGHLKPNDPVVIQKSDSSSALKRKLPLLSDSDPAKQNNSVDAPPKSKSRSHRDEPRERMIIPEEVKAVAGGLPPSFPKRLLKKYSEPRLLDAGREPSPERKKRRTFVPGLNPRRKEKSPNLFVDTTLEQVKGLHPYLVSNLLQNYEIRKLTKIQDMAIPKLLSFEKDNQGLNMIINSQIGSGKTLSYIIPVINTLVNIEPKINRTDGVHALILLPTREQAAIVNDIFVKLCRSFTWIVPGLLVGGERKKSEKARIRKGLNILITTPGRLIDHIQHTHKLNFSKVKYFILADAHKLLDPERVEAAHQIVAIMRKQLPNSCIKCMVTATMTRKIEKLADMILKKPYVLDAFQKFE